MIHLQGNPKGVMLTHGNIAINIATFFKYIFEVSAIIILKCETFSYDQGAADRKNCIGCFFVDASVQGGLKIVSRLCDGWGGALT